MVHSWICYCLPGLILPRAIKIVESMGCCSGVLVLVHHRLWAPAFQGKALTVLSQLPADGATSKIARSGDLLFGAQILETERYVVDVNELGIPAASCCWAFRGV